MERTQRSDLIVGFQTHPGETGKNNEDRAVVLSYRGAPGDNGGITLAVVADGIGGHQAGEVASQFAVDAVTKLFDHTDSRAYLDLFARAFADTAHSISRHTSRAPDAGGMGTTCAVVVIANRRLYTAYIGDSRIYLIREGGVRQTTVDHTWVQEAIEHGILTRQEARKHPNRHVVRRYLGSQPDPTPDYRLQLSDAELPEAATHNQGLPLKPGDVVLLCSDGLTDLVEDHEILAAFHDHAAPQAAVDALTLLARQRGGFDNITVVALQVPGKPRPPSPSGSRLGGSTMALSLFGGLGLAAAAIALVAALVAGYFYWVNLQPTPTPTVISLSPTASLPPPVASPTPTPQQATLLPDTPTPITPTATKTSPPTPTFTPSPTINLTALAATAAGTPSSAGATPAPR